MLGQSEVEQCRLDGSGALDLGLESYEDLQHECRLASAVGKHQICLSKGYWGQNVLKARGNGLKVHPFWVAF